MLKFDAGGGGGGGGGGAGGAIAGGGAGVELMLPPPPPLPQAETESAKMIDVPTAMLRPVPVLAISLPNYNLGYYDRVACASINAVVPCEI